jgi:glycosyltransferase involved in cell wall biosynthesis
MPSKISVVIPAYNVAPYIEKCLQSVLCQTYTNLEVLVINDGSTDDTVSLIKGFTADERLVFLDQPNAGVSAARNAGVAAATGEYLTFVDSDDWIEPTMYEKLHEAITNAAADMAVCNYNLVYADRTAACYSKMHGEVVTVYDDIYAYFCRYCACPKPNNYIWTRLYRTELVKNSGVRFENYRQAEDTLFNFKLLPYMRKIAFIPEGLYNYYQRGNSAVYTTAKKGNLAAVYADTFDALADYYKAGGFDEFLPVLSIHAFTRMKSVFFYSRLAGLSEAEIVESVMVGFRGREIAAYLTGAAR